VKETKGPTLAKSNPGGRTRLWGLAVGVSAGLLLAIVMTVAGQPTFAGDSPESDLPDPNRQLAEAKAAAPYEVKYPSAVPQGTVLEHVDWDVHEGTVVAIDIWFALPTGGRLHIWQTNTVEPISTDSIPQGEAVSIEGISWSRVSVDWGGTQLLQLSRQFEDGVTVAADAALDTLSAEGLARVVGSIA
jgi:hypothetical protein